MPEVVTEAAIRDSEYILSEANGDRSREQVTIAAAALATELVAGTVLGKITASGKYTRHDVAAVDGSQTAVAVAFATIPAGAADVRSVITARDATVNGKKLTWKTGIIEADKTAGEVALAGQGIIVRY